MAKFLCDVVNEIWYNCLKDAYIFYTKVTTLNIMALLDTNSGGFHPIDMITLHMNMTQYYVQTDGIPQFIVIMEDAQKKMMQAGMPITNVDLVMMALAAVLAAQHFPPKVDDWDGLPTKACTWQAWKVAFHLSHLKRQHQLQALGGGKPLGGAHTVIPVFAPTINRIGAALKNLAGLNDTTVLQQLMAANLLLMALVALLMMANKKLVDALARNKGVASPAVASTTGGACMTNKPFLGNYC